MLELGPAQECEMILAFLKAEVDSSRFGNTVNAWIAAKHFTRNELIENADLSDPQQNQARLGILRGYRGYGRDVFLFRGFPADVVYRRIKLEPHEVDKLKYANEPAWVEMSDGTRKPLQLVEKLNRGEIAPNPADHIRAIQQALTEGKKFPELIAVEGPASELILVEGHSRATAYVASRLNNGIKMFLASSPSMRDWAYY